jgi:hypothetical protein
MSVLHETQQIGTLAVTITATANSTVMNIEGESEAVRDIALIKSRDCPTLAVISWKARNGSVSIWEYEGGSIDLALITLGSTQSMGKTAHFIKRTFPNSTAVG